jgi:hypothetical protein
MKKITFTSDAPDMETELEAYYNDSDMIYISITDNNADIMSNMQHVVLDINTAKELLDYLSEQVAYLED